MIDVPHRRILSVIAPKTRAEECEICGKVVQHAWSTYYVRESHDPEVIGQATGQGMLVGEASKPFTHIAPCGLVCAHGAPPGVTHPHVHTLTGCASCAAGLKFGER